ncbi:MAG: exodeoxyribonuclease III [Christensenellales bacterium]|jgi:exodeoxyribonuclease-3
MKIISWNVNGIRSAAKKGLMEWVADYQPDILCLQETKAWEEQLEDGVKKPEGYRSVFCSAQRKGYSGVATYYKVAPVSQILGLGIEAFDGEGRVIVSEYETFYLLNIYFPNGQMSEERLKFKLDFYDAYLAYVQELRTSGKAVITCGDYNTAHKPIDLARPKANEKVSGFLPVERAWMDKYTQHGYVDTFREFQQEGSHYSWWNVRTRARERNVGWRIDYFFIDAEHRNMVKDAFILPEVYGSDHCPVGIELEI